MIYLVFVPTGQIVSFRRDILILAGGYLSTVILTTTGCYFSGVVLIITGGSLSGVVLVKLVGKYYRYWVPVPVTVLH